MQGILRGPLPSSYKIEGHQITAMTLKDEVDKVRNKFKYAAGVGTNRIYEYEIKILRGGVGASGNINKLNIHLP